MNVQPTINDISKMFCDFEDSGTTHKGRKVYVCKYCNIKLAMDSPSTKVMCFSKKRELDELLNPQAEKPIDGIKNPDKIVEIAAQQLIDKGGVTEQTFDIEQRETNQQNNMCSKEQIDARMAVCQKCEYFQENSCLLCGCNIVRERNYNNKLAKKDQHCPIFKWKPIKD